MLFGHLVQSACQADTLQRALIRVSSIHVLIGDCGPSLQTDHALLSGQVTCFRQLSFQHDCGRDLSKFVFSFRTAQFEFAPVHKVQVCGGLACPEHYLVADSFDFFDKPDEFKH